MLSTKLNPVILTENPIPTDVEYEPDISGGCKVECLDCGLDWESAWDRGGVGDIVWTYSADRRGVSLYVRAECRGCGRVEVFEESGGNASGYARDPRDYDRKHETNHESWKTRMCRRTT